MLHSLTAIVLFASVSGDQLPEDYALAYGAKCMMIRSNLRLDPQHEQHKVGAGERQFFVCTIGA